MSRVDRPRASWPTFARRVLVAVVLVIAVAFMVLVVWAEPATPDAFYTAPGPVPATPGALIRSEPFTRGVPADARAWRILYTTTREGGAPALASAIVLASTRAPAGPRPIIAWAHGTTGVAPGCAPSLLEDYLATGGLPALSESVAQGWVLVATDYAGMGTDGPAPYLIGDGEARSVLDSVRAAQQLETVQVERGAVVWGHSQGGHAALWTGVLAPTYAPDLNVHGVAALAPASDLTGLLAEVQATDIGQIISAYLAQAYSQTYPEITYDEIVRPGARLLAGDLARRCLSGRKAILSVIEAFAIRGSIFSVETSGDGSFARRLRQNIPNHPIPAPLLIAQGLTDELVLPHLQDAFVKQRCAAGQPLEFRTYSRKDHLQLVQQSIELRQDLIAWTQARLDGVPPAAGCQTIGR